ncbi:MAG: hypothetical protein RIQ68_1295 [Pseudomonadota bacterium]|jgi:hypothetical protein
MSTVSYKDFTLEELLHAYEDIVKKQNVSFLNEDNDTYNQQYWIHQAIVDELRSRDQREALAVFLNRREPFFRICAARDTYSLNPERARKYMQTIVDYPFDPYRGEAASALGSWDRGHTPR